MEQDGQPARHHPPPSASASASPNREFSFTISLHHPSTKAPPQPSIAVDLSPADEIFFHGHLLPLHLLSHLPVSPRDSINSLDSFTLPIKELPEDPPKPSTVINPNNSCLANERPMLYQPNPNPKPKSKPFWLFGLRRKGPEERESEREREREKQKRRQLKFELSDLIKRYSMRMVGPLLMSLKGRKEKVQLRKQPHSFSGVLSPRGGGVGGGGGEGGRGWRGEIFSAPASMRTSRTNSGHLVPTVPTSAASDSTMEELQAAIQAAIAHCKNSIAMEDDKIISQAKKYNY